ncbi:MAG: zinc ribbon domain-containing protein [Dehalococcoidia bacterium]|nr:zinc ribbon domain-containing protein [Dehalococcoidia bacterium]
MIGKIARTSKYTYRCYYCANAQKSRAKCSFYNGHVADKLEKAVLDYLGQFSDPAKVKELVEKSISDSQAHNSIETRQKELKAAEKRISQLQELVLKDIDRLDRGILTEGEYTAVSQVRREEIAQLKAEVDTLTAIMAEAKAKTDTVERVPVQIQSLFEDFNTLDIRLQKARLQEIVKAISLFSNDDRLEIEFR